MNEVPITLKNERPWFYWGLLILSFIACYFPTFQWLNNKYLIPDSYYSHGYLIPFISAYLIYQKRSLLMTIPLSSSSIGLAVIIFSLMLHIVGVLGDVNFVSSFAMLIYATGCVLFLLGSAFARAIAFPLFYLVFMCPLPTNLIDTVALPSKSMATSFALTIIDLLGIPYVREGFRIIFSHSTFVVGTPCNGMRSLISFLALGVLLLSFIRMKWWKIGLFLACIPVISIALNGIRIALLLIIAHFFGQEAAAPESYLHDSSGLLVFIIGLALMIIFTRWMNEEHRN